MNALTFQIHLLEPVLVTQLGAGDPNSAIGFNFIPGSVIRGALISKYLHGKKGDAANDDFRRLFFDGKVRFLNAYPRSRLGERTLPTPISWHVEKENEEPVYDFAIDDSVIENDKSYKVWKVVNKPFCRIWENEKGKQQTEFYDPVSLVKIHTFRADRQNVTEEGSTIFRYLALDSGQDFAGVMLADDRSDIDIIKNIFAKNPILSFGKSHLVGYGRVKIDAIKIEVDWTEYDSADDDGAESDIIVTLLSDAIVCDSKTGAHVASIEPILNVTPTKVFLRTCVRGGFNRTWNLPLPQTLAIEAGSVFVYKNNPMLRKRLQNLEPSGIGEKREEGFGRIAIDWTQSEKIIVKTSYSSHPLTVNLEGKSVDFARKIVNRMLRVKLDEALIRTVNEKDITGITESIHNSQLSRMRAIARRAWSENDADLILQHIEKMKKPARSQFEHAIIDKKSLYEWLKEMAEAPNNIKYTLGVNSDNLSIGTITPDMTPEMNLEYTVRMIDGILHKALKEGNK